MTEFVIDDTAVDNIGKTLTHHAEAAATISRLVESLPTISSGPGPTIDPAVGSFRRSGRSELTSLQAALSNLGGNLLGAVQLLRGTQDNVIQGWNHLRDSITAPPDAIAFAHNPPVVLRIGAAWSAAIDAERGRS